MCFICIAVLAFACSSIKNDKESEEESMSEIDRWVLDLDENNQVLIPLIASPSTDLKSGIATIAFYRLDNPNKVSTQIELALQFLDDNSRVEIGNFSFYPVDNPGEFIFDVNRFIPNNADWDSVNVEMRLKRLENDDMESNVVVYVRPVSFN